MVTQEQIEEIVRILVRDCQPEKIILFGSYAKGTASEESDLDLAIVKKTDLPKFKRPIEFQKALRSGGKKWFFPMDILVYTPEEIEGWKNNPYSLVHEILNTGKTLYESARPARLVYQS
jgi:predicted nucleotidyltransferase